MYICSWLVTNLPFCEILAREPFGAEVLGTITVWLARERMFWSNAPTISCVREPASLPAPSNRLSALIWKDWFSIASSWMFLGRDIVLAGAAGTLPALVTTLLSIYCIGRVGTKLAELWSLELYWSICLDLSNALNFMSGAEMPLWGYCSFFSYPVVVLVVFKAATCVGRLKMRIFWPFIFCMWPF